jgi:acyl-CoA thioester hydrolase
VKPFEYERRVAFSDTDAMGVTHHANYIRYLEEARVAWMRARGLSGTHYPHEDRVLAVLRFQVWHKKTCTFDDALKIQLQVRRDGLKIHFQYAVCKNGERIAEAETVHIPVDGKLKPKRPSPELTAQLEKEPWTETWLSNS